MERDEGSGNQAGKGIDAAPSGFAAAAIDALCARTNGCAP